ncbi:MAG TPA: TRAP transporter small permease [Burkholderiales bacterium]|nr:TRAP transporter small permease [Burkholderiales bacterium]
MEKAYQIWRAFQDLILARAAALLLLGCTLLALLEIFRRYILGVSFEWQQDAVTFFILSGVFLYFGISQRHNEHLNVAVLTESLDSLGPRARRASEVVKLTALVFSFIFLVAVVWWGVPEVRDAIEYEGRTESLAFPMWPFLMVLLVGFAFMAVTMFFQIYLEIQKLRGRAVVEETHEVVAPE